MIAPHNTEPDIDSDIVADSIRAQTRLFHAQAEEIEIRNALQQKTIRDVNDVWMHFQRFANAMKEISVGLGQSHWDRVIDEQLELSRQYLTDPDR